jgi:hypothetical protein
MSQRTQHRVSVGLHVPRTTLVRLTTERFVRAVGARTSAALLATLVSYIWKSSADV